MPRGHQSFSHCTSVPARTFPVATRWTRWHWAVLADLAGFAFVTRGQEYTVLDYLLVQTRVHLPPDQVQQCPESQMVRRLSNCPQIPVGPGDVLSRVAVATHPARKKKSPGGVTREGTVYELFFMYVPQQAFTASDVVELYLHCRPLILLWLMRTENRTPIDGAATPPGDRSAGRSCRRGNLDRDRSVPQRTTRTKNDVVNSSHKHLRRPVCSLCATPPVFCVLRWGRCRNVL